MVARELFNLFSKNRLEYNKYLSDLVLEITHEAQEVRQVLDNDSEGKGFIYGPNIYFFGL